jgi:uncharacterized membrane protein
MDIRHAITLRGERSDVERSWQQHKPDWADGASVLFTEAPGDRGTEIHVRLESSGNALTQAVAKVTGSSQDSTVKDELRHFKQIFETGEIVRSEGSPEGQQASRQLHQEPAQPRAER